MAGAEGGRPQALDGPIRRLGAPLAAAALAVLALAGSSPRSASAGGPFERLVGVGAGGDWREVRLAPTGARSDASLLAGGAHVARPSGGYVRLFPMVGGLPGIPGRYYPGRRVLCWSWQQPDRGCWRANETAVRLLGPLAHLPVWRQEPTVLSELRYQGRRVRPALANLLVGLELAFERRSVTAGPAPAQALRFTGRWRGPAAASRPRRFALGPSGVYAGRVRYPLERGVWAFADANRLPGATTAGLTVPAKPAALYESPGRLRSGCGESMRKRCARVRDGASRSPATPSVGASRRNARCWRSEATAAASCA